MRPAVEANPSVQRLKWIPEQSKRTSRTWDIDTFPLSSPVKEAGEICYPRVVLALDKAPGTPLHVGIVKPDERDWNPEASRRGGWMPTETHSEAMAAMRRFGIILGRPGDLAEPHGRLLELSAAPYSSG